MARAVMHLFYPNLSLRVFNSAAIFHKVLPAWVGPNIELSFSHSFLLVDLFLPSVVLIRLLRKQFTGIFTKMPTELVCSSN